MIPHIGGTGVAIVSEKKSKIMLRIGVVQL